MDIFGDRLQDLRKYRKIKQSQLASALNINQRTISNWENYISEPTIEEILLLSTILNAPVEYFFGEDTYTKKLIEISKQILIKKIEANHDDFFTFTAKRYLNILNTQPENSFEYLKAKYSFKDIAKNYLLKNNDFIPPEQDLISGLLIEKNLLQELNNPKIFSI